MDQNPSKKTMSDRVASTVMRYNLPAIAVLVIIQIACVIIIEDKTLIAVVSTATGGVITSLINERLMLIQYFFGSSHGSKTKEKTIDDSMRKKDKQ